MFVSTRDDVMQAFVLTAYRCSGSLEAALISVLDRVRRVDVPTDSPPLHGLIRSCH